MEKLVLGEFIGAKFNKTILATHQLDMDKVIYVKVNNLDFDNVFNDIYNSVTRNIQFRHLIEEHILYDREQRDAVNQLLPF